MTSDIEPKPEICNCSALRQAARHVTRFYDAFLSPAGLRATQFSILAKLRQRGPLTITSLAAEMVMDRTTLGRNIRPLQRRGLAAITAAKNCVLPKSASSGCRRLVPHGARHNGGSMLCLVSSAPLRCASFFTSSR
jgi:hypothetical protein